MPTRWSIEGSSRNKQAMQDAGIFIIVLGIIIPVTIFGVLYWIFWRVLIKGLPLDKIEKKHKKDTAKLQKRIAEKDKNTRKEKQAN